MASTNAPAAARLTSVQWLVCAIASIGFAFDIYELLMLPLIVRPALLELIGQSAAPGTETFNFWVGMLFFVPAFAGGIFGLFGGYLTDRLGRRRVLTWSILLYALSAFAAGYSTNIYMLLFFRCTMFVGVCIEFVAAVAWLAELFPNPEQRERVLGYTQAFSSVGGLLVAIVNSWIVVNVVTLPAIHVPDWLVSILGPIQEEHAAWRYTLMSGIVPALPLIIIRPFLPESPAWQKKRAEGTLKRPSIRALFAPELRRVTVVTTLMFACSYGAAFGAIQHIPQMVPGLANVKEKAKQAADAAAEKDPVAAKDPKARVRTGKLVEQKVAAEYVKLQEIGGLVGRFLLALLAVRIVSRRKLLRVFQGPGLIVVPLVFYFFLRVENTEFFTVDLTAVYLGELPVTTVSLGVLLAGLVTVAQFSFWGNYLPRVYPLHLRGTGESFAANIGGRMLGTSFAWVTTTIAATQNPADAPMRMALTAAGVALFVYLAGSILCFFLPEPEPEMTD